MDVFLRRVDDYGPSLGLAVSEVLEKGGCRPPFGTRVLVKPNLIGRRNARLSCTRAEVVLAVCSYLLDYGARVEVGDSPAFGGAPGVARASGLAAPLARLGVKLLSLDSPRRVPLSMGGYVGISARALDADMLLNLPKLKAHSQMRVTGAVKNFFGMVAGFRKALAHTVHGDKGARFQSVIIETMLAAPPSFTLLDGVEAMHVRGPLDGTSYPLHMVAASTNPVAVDTAVYSVLGLLPGDVPLWEECRRRGLPGAGLEELRFPLAGLGDFDGSGFRAPEVLSPMTFHPVRLMRGRLKSLWERF